jgi:hypothetical protein
MQPKVDLNNLIRHGGGMSMFEQQDPYQHHQQILIQQQIQQLE